MGLKKERATRFGTFMLAMLFLVTSIGFSLLVIWQVRQQNKQEEAQSQLTKAQNSTESKDKTNQEGENMLKGTKLQGFTPITSPVTAIQATDTVVGTGAELKGGATITAHYTGALVATGVVFESSHDSGKPFTAKLQLPTAENGGQGLITGWVEGLQGMKAGGTRRLVIPYLKAYGEEGNPPTIPAKADLVFDIELISIGQ